MTLHRLQVYSASLLLGVPAAPAAAPAGVLAAASAPAGSGLPAASAPAAAPYQRYPSPAGRAGGARLGAPAAAPAPGTILTVMGVACQLPFYFRGAAHSQCVTVSPDQPGTYCLDVEGDIGRCSAGLTRQYANFSRWVDQWADNPQVRPRPAAGRPPRARAPTGASPDVMRLNATAQGSESRPSRGCRRHSQRLPALCARRGPLGGVRGAGASVGDLR